MLYRQNARQYEETAMKIETERLIIRPLEEGDGKTLAKLAEDGSFSASLTEDGIEVTAPEEKQSLGGLYKKQ